MEMGICIAVFVAVSVMGVRLEIVGKRIARSQEVIMQTREMHLHPDEHGFGTETTNRLLRESGKLMRDSAVATDKMTGAINRLIHYMMHEYEQRTGTKPPPPPPERIG